MRSPPARPVSPRRVFFVAGPGDAIRAHKHWREGRHDPTEVAITFSGQIEEYCKDVGAKLYIVSYHYRREKIVDGAVTVEHLPKFWPNASGALYHVRELLYGLKLLKRAVQFRADAAILDSGCRHYFWQTWFAVFGMRVTPVLHNALWPHGYKPMGLVDRTLRALDRPFWRYVPVASLCVSPTCARQVEELAGAKARPRAQIRAQFDKAFFEAIPPPPPPEQRPFRIMFVGRVTRSKGVFDILEMAQAVEARAPGRVRWTLCGTGDDIEELKQHRARLALQDVVDIRGWTSLEDLARVYAQSHCAIVPTRSSFIEGLAMTAAEAALAGRPVITNPVVPALEIIAPAAIACRTDEPQSYVAEILKLIDDPARYNRLAAAARESAKPFLDRRYGLTAVLKEVLGEARATETPPTPPRPPVRQRASAP